MSYVAQHVLPDNWAAQMTNALTPTQTRAYANRAQLLRNNAMSGLGLAPIADSFSGGVPAFPLPLPSVARFRTRRSEVRQAVLPSYAVREAIALPPVTSTAMKPDGAVWPFMRSPIGMHLSGLGAYSSASFKPFYESGGCGCNNAGLGDLSLPVVGDVDMKTAALVIGGLLLFQKLASGVGSVRKSFRRRRAKAAA